MAVSHPEWDNEYCSVNCCYNYCKYVLYFFVNITEKLSKIFIFLESYSKLGLQPIKQQKLKLI